MNSLTLDMTHGSLTKQILLFSLPLMLSNVLQVLFNMSDIAVVGRFGGAVALGAVGSTATLVTLFTGFLIGMGSGVNVVTARYFGSSDEDAVSRTVHSAAILCSLIGMVILALGLVFARPFLELLNTKDELIDGAALYLRIYFLGMPAMALYNFGSAVLSAAGDTRRPLIYLSVSGALNVLLNLFFVIFCDMDVDGVAIASVISQYLSAVLIIIALLRSKGSFALRFDKLRLDPIISKSILVLGIPAGLQHAIFAIANLFIQSAVNSFDAVTVEGNSAAANSDALIYDIMNAFYTACSSFIGQNYGAGNRKRILQSYFISLAYAFIFSGVISGLFVIFGRQFLSLFTKEADVVEAGMVRLTVMGCCYAFSAFMDNTTAAARGLGHSVVPTVIVILGSCVFRVIWIYTIFAHFHTMFSLYILYIFSWTITSIAEIIYFFRCYKRLDFSHSAPNQAS